ncbi:hypothetical protein HF313_21695 [Massilia atriviolacea]|uniref:Toxin VasX N-terminal region domain-containing protein n=1 Tax=Massilia atriviolacea TaxID=2495579 RepID=A0A430HFA4_9BURK|nr:T6SS effector BTH_I2691 family protein [Massilia atriviolacea]RSZ56189.1 hypothetical protein EJB06_25130 [Massilia atriviolacea]
MSDTAIATPKQKIIDKASKAVAGKPVCDPKSPCQPCQRADLQLLVVLPSVVPSDHTPALGAAGYSWSSNFDAALAATKREATTRVARIMREGYVYLYYFHRKRWDVWQVMNNGLTRKIMNQVDKAAYEKLQGGFVGAPVPKSCSRGAANVPAHLISVQGAKTTPKVWMAFSSQLWSGFALQRYADNPAGTVPGPDGKSIPVDLRALRGCEINPQAILEGTLPPTALPLRTDVLEHSVADFVKSGNDVYRSAFAAALSPMDERRFGLAQTFSDSVRELERASAPPGNPKLYLEKSIVLMLPDALGVVEEHNHLRLIEQDAKKMWTIGANGVSQKPDPERSWKLLSAQHADMIEQWEAASEAKSITDAAERDLESMHAPVTEEVFIRGRDAGKYPPGTDWFPLHIQDGGREGFLKMDASGKPIEQTVASIYKPGTQTRLGRLILPPDMVQKAANRRGADRATGFRDRLRGRLKYGEMKAFSDAYKAESDLWDKRILRFDRDYLAWRDSAPFKELILYDYNCDISLAKIVPAFGTVDQQVGEVMARTIALEKAFGGGAITPDSAKAMAAQYKLKPEDPASWIDSSLYKPFSWNDNLVKDKGNQSEAVENVAAVYELGVSVIEAIQRHKHRQHYESAARSLLASRAQLTMLVASAVDPITAKKLGLTAHSATQAQKYVKMNLSIELLMEDLLSPTPGQRAAEKFVFNFKIPAGVAISEVQSAMHGRIVPAEFSEKKNTSRAQRRYTQRQFRALRGRFKGEMNYPILVDKELIAKMQREATPGTNMVKVVPDSVLGKSSGVIEIPEAVARRMIREQAFKYRSLSNLKSANFMTLGGIGFVQVMGLLEAAKKISGEQGLEQIDGTLSTLSSVMGVAETLTSFKLHAWTMRTDGMRTMLATTASKMALIRVAAGSFGVAGGLIDAALAFIKADYALRSGDKQTAEIYKTAGRLYVGSSVLSGLGTFAAYQGFMGGSIARMVGVRALMLMGAWAVGVGVLLALAAFGYMLYALHTAYQKTDLFLDRSYWGKGEHEKFGINVRQQLDVTHANPRLNHAARGAAINVLVNDGMTAEVEAFLALTIGISVDFEWHKNWFDDEAVAVKFTAGAWPENRTVKIKIELYAKNSTRIVVMDVDGAVLTSKIGDDGKEVFELEKAWVFKDDSHERYSHARVNFSAHEKTDNGVDLVMRDTLVARRDA